MGLFSSAKRQAPTQYSAGQLRMQTPQLANREALRAQIESAFGGREALPEQAASNIRDFNTMRLGEERGRADTAARQNLARSGQVGSSQDIASLAQRNLITEDALRETEADALTAANQLRAGDVQARGNLLGSVDAGLAPGDAISAALNNLAYESEQQRDLLQGRAIGNAAAQFGNLIPAYHEGEGRRRAYFSGASGGSLPKPYGGTIFR